MNYELIGVALLLVALKTKSKPVKTSKKGIELIKRFEGFKLFAYDANPPRKDMTIGYGHKIKAGESFPNGIDRELAETLLIQDLAMAENRVKSFIKIPLNQDKFDALVSAAFNLTYSSWKAFSARINAGENPANVFGLYVYGGGVKLAGLVSRRDAESKLYQTGIA